MPVEQRERELVEPLGGARDGAADSQIPLPTRDHRPAASGGPSEVSRPARGVRVLDERAGRFQRSARSGAKVSLVTSPAQTRSHKRVQDLALGGRADDRARTGRPSCRGLDGAEERGAAGPEVFADRLVERRFRRRRGVRDLAREQELAAGAVKDHSAVVAAQAAVAHPRHLPERAQLVEQARLVTRNARRQHVPLQHGSGNRHARQLVDDLGQALERGAAAERRRVRANGDHALPRRQEPPERLRVDRLHLAPESGQRAPPEHARGPRDRTTPAPCRTDGTRHAGSCRQRPAGPARPPRRRAAGPTARRARSRGTARACGPSARAARRARPSRGPGTPPGRRAAARRRRRPGSGRRPRWRPSGRRRRCASGPRAGSRASSRNHGSAAAAPPSTRAAASDADRSPTRRSRSCTCSRLFACRSSLSDWSESSRSASASGSSSSRSSSWPSSSRRRSRSSASAPARRSASGASPSYMYAAT